MDDSVDMNPPTFATASTAPSTTAPTLTAAGAGLSLDTLHAARERDTALDLDDTIGELLTSQPA